MRFLKIVQQQANVSRRQAQALIEAGRVRLNGEPTGHPFSDVALEDVKSLHVDGQRVSLTRDKTGVYCYYKPSGMLCSFKDPHHHHAMGKVLRRPELRGYRVAGRLDRDAEGLLLLTNDGDLLHWMTHPRYEVEKVYHVLVPQVLRYRQTGDAIRQMKAGISDAGERLTVRGGRIAYRTNEETTVELVLNEGKNHEVKRLCRHFGWHVRRLVRVGMAGVALGQLRSGQLKPLPRAELNRLLARYEDETGAN